MKAETVAEAETERATKTEAETEPLSTGISFGY